MSKHYFNRVGGADFHKVSGSESRPDLLLQTDFNETYYSVFSQAQQQLYRVNERSLGSIHRARANSCPDIVRQLDRDYDELSNINWKYTTAHEGFIQLPTTLKMIRKLKQHPYSHYM